MRHPILLALGLALLSTATGCTGDVAELDSGEGATVDPDRREYDPPSRFDTEAAVHLDLTAEPGEQDAPSRTQPWALHGTIVYALSSSALTAFDADTGKRLAEVEPEGDTGRGLVAKPPPPAVVDTGDDTVVVAPFMVDAPSEGTQREEMMLEIVAVDVKSNKRAWSFTIDLDDYDPNYQVELSPPLVSATAVAFDMSGGDSEDDDRHETFVIDPVEHELAWRKADFDAGAIAGEVLAGSAESTDPDSLFNDEPRTVTGLDLADGDTAWDLTDRPVGRVVAGGEETLVVFNPQTRREDDPNKSLPTRFMFVEAASGEKITATEEVWEGGVDCAYDGQDTVVCDNMGGNLHSLGGLGGYDLDSGELLWSLPEDDRDAPVPTALWHGSLYGLTANGPVIVDARTGTDAETDPGGAPSLVNGYLGITATDGTVTALPAIA